jgi:hypothetical protein
MLGCTTSQGKMIRINVNLLQSLCMQYIYLGMKSLTRTIFFSFVKIVFQNLNSYTPNYLREREKIIRPKYQFITKSH